MFNDLPLEVVETILLYLNGVDIEAFCRALGWQFNIFSDYFMKIVCSKEGFTLSHPEQSWLQCFGTEINRRLGRYSHICILNFVPIYAYDNVIVAQIVNNEEHDPLFHIYLLGDQDKFILVQKITAKSAYFRENFIVAKKAKCIKVYSYNYTSNLFKHVEALPKFSFDLVGVNKNYCVLFSNVLRLFKVYTFGGQCSTYDDVVLPPDAKHILQADNILRSDEIIVSVDTIVGEFEIKVYNLKSKAWTLNLCLGCIGLSVPDVWIGIDFLGCCCTFFRSTSVNYSPFNVWNNQGISILQLELPPSDRQYFNCFFKVDTIFVTTSDTEISVFNNVGQIISKVTTSLFEDIKVSTGHLMFIALNDRKTVQVHDWARGVLLYSVRFNKEFYRFICSQLIYCACDITYAEAIRFDRYKHLKL